MSSGMLNNMKTYKEPIKNVFGNTKKDYRNLMICFGGYLFIVAVGAGVKMGSVLTGILYTFLTFCLSFVFIVYWMGYEKMKLKEEYPSITHSK